MPDDVRISAQMIVGEQTEFALRCLQASLACLRHPDIVNIVVGMHSSCSSRVIEWLIKEWEPSGKAHTLLKVSGDGFADWRNCLLSDTPEEATHILKVDADETYIHSSITRMAEAARQFAAVDAFMVKFYHLMREPEHHQPGGAMQVTLFRKGGLWSKDVHEGWSRVGKPKYLDLFSFVHWGYAKPPLQTFLKWLHYAVLEHGDLKSYRYEEDGSSYLRDWRTPLTILDDRPLENMPEAAFPKPAVDLILRSYRESGSSWSEWLADIDPDVQAWYEASLAHAGGDWQKWLDRLEDGYWPNFGAQQ